MQLSHLDQERVGQRRLEDDADPLIGLPQPPLKTLAGGAAQGDPGQGPRRAQIFVLDQALEADVAAGQAKGLHLIDVVGRAPESDPRRW